MINIEIETMQERFEVTSGMQETLHRVIETVLGIEGIDGEGEVAVSLVDEEAIKDLNREHRGKDEVTDVLSFPQYASLDEIRAVQGYLVLGDIVLCAGRAAEQAEEFGHSLERELAYLVVHSLYHLMGYDHLESAEKAAMREKEEFALERLGIRR